MKVGWTILGLGIKDTVISLEGKTATRTDTNTSPEVLTRPSHPVLLTCNRGLSPVTSARERELPKGGTRLAQSIPVLPETATSSLRNTIVGLVPPILILLGYLIRK